MTPITDPSVIAELFTAINSDSFGSEQIDRIISVASVPAQGYEGEDTIVIAQSGIKQLVFLMNDTRPKGQTFQSRILNPEDLGDDANFAEYPLDDRDDLDVITDRLREANLTGPWLETLMDKLKESGDLRQFSESLEEMYSDLDSEAFRSAMLGAVSVSSLAGYSEAESLPALGNSQQTQSVQVDRQFIEMMIPHHQDAIVMADLALTSGKRSEVKELATSIKQDQTSEIQQMRTWYKQWYGTAVPAYSMTDMGMMGDHHAQKQGTGLGMDQGMMNMKMDINALKTSKDFDKEFVRQMIPHHQMAVMMSQIASQRAAHPDLRNLAQSIIKSQNAEIAKMQGWQKSWN